MKQKIRAKIRAMSAFFVPLKARWCSFIAQNPETKALFEGVLLIILFTSLTLIGKRLEAPLAIKLEQLQEHQTKFKRAALSNWDLQAKTSIGNLKLSFDRRNDQVVVQVDKNDGQLRFKNNLKNSDLEFDEKNSRFISEEQNMEISYQALDNGIKEKIILYQLPENNRFYSQIEIDNLAVYREGKYLVFENEDGKYQFHLDAPYAYDAAGSTTYNVHYQIIEVDAEAVLDQNLSTFNVNRLPRDRNQVELLNLPEQNLEAESGKLYQLVTIVDQDWLFSPERQAPITIDPTIIYDSSNEFAGGELHNLSSGEKGPGADINTVSLWHFDEPMGSQKDSGLANNTGTSFDAGYTINGKYGNARSFNGSSSYINVGDASELTFNRDFTIEAWINPTSTSGAKAIFSHGGSEYYLRINNGKLHFLESWVGSILIGNSTIQTDTWTHVAVTVSADATATVTLYVNGVADGSTTTTATLNDGSQIATIGRDTGTGGEAGEYFSGTIDEVRISDKALTVDEINAHINDHLITGEFQPVAADIHTIGLWRLDETSGSLTDSSSNSNSGTATGTTSIHGVVGNARSFNGTSDYISLGDPTALQQNKGDQTIEMWLYPTDFSSRRNPFAKAYGGEGTITQETNGTLNYYYGIAGGNAAPYDYVNSGKSLSLYQWQHVAVVRDLGNRKLYWYINGEQVSQKDAEYAWAASSTLTAYIGQGYAGYYKGAIDEVIISNQALGAEEIKSHASYRPHSTYTSDVIDLTQVSSWNDLSWLGAGLGTGDGEIATASAQNNIIAQWNFNDTSGTTADNAESTSALDGTLTNFAQTGSQDAVAGSGWTADNKKWGAGALMFDGVDDTVVIGSESSFDFERTDEFTLEAWIKTNSNNTQTIINKYQYDSPWVGYELRMDSTGILHFVFNNTASTNCINVETNSVINDNQWHHIVLTYNGSSKASGVKIYIDSKNQEIVTNYDNLTASTLTNFSLRIGSRETGVYPFLGIIDAVKVYDRALTPFEVLSNYNGSQIEFETRVGATSDPNDGSWEAWKPSSPLTQLLDFDDSYLYNISDTGLVSYWSMNDTSGTTVTDHKGSNDGTATGTSIIDGVFNNGRGFNGSSDYINAGNLSIGTTLTVEAWINTSTVNTAQAIIGKRSSANTWAFYVRPNGQIGFTLNGVADYNSSTANLKSGIWQHVVATINGTSLTIYVNGASVYSTTMGASIANDSTPLGIGSMNGSGIASPFSGSIDEVRLYSTALSASTIREHYLAGSSNASTLFPQTDTVINLEGNASQHIEFGRSKLDEHSIGLWRLDETSGTGAYVKDSSVNANHGTPSGTPSSIPGIFNRGLRFTDSQGVIVPHNSSLTPSSGKITIESWFKTGQGTSAAYQSSIIDKVNNGGSYPGYRMSTGGGWLNCWFGAGAYVTSTSPVIDNKWHHGACTYDGSKTRVYVDGDLEGEVTQTANLSATADLYIGWNYNGVVTGFVGDADEVRISNYARNNDEIRESYRAGRDQHISQETTSTDLSSSSKIAFDIASDRLGTFSKLIFGESPFANYEADDNTVGLWHLDELDNRTDYYLKGTSFRTNDWTEIDSVSKFSVNDGIILSAGTTTGWDAAIISNRTYTRENGLKLRATFVTSTSVTSPNHMMIGFANNSTSNASYTNITHALYFNAGTLAVYQDGTAIVGSLLSGYTTSTVYEVEITLNGDGTKANYAIRGGAYTDWTTVYQADTAKSNTPLRVQVSNYRHNGTIRNISVIQNTDSEDFAGNNEGENIGTGSSDNAILGKARYFNGTSDYIELNDDDLSDITSAYTIEGWLYFSSWGAHDNNPIPLPNNYNSGGGVWVHHSPDGIKPRQNNNILATCDNHSNELGVWTHEAYTWDGSTLKTYQNGELKCTYPLSTTPSFSSDWRIGMLARYDAHDYNHEGYIDEVRVSNIARTAEELRQAYEIGKRSHNITVDFKAELDSGNLITGSSDTSFIIDETAFGSTAAANHLFAGDKIIVKENYDGTQYIAQGTVNSVNASTGAITVTSWDAGSSFPTSGYTVGATVFKWQREYFDISDVLSSHRDAVAQVSLHTTDGAQGANIWLDDLNAASYLGTETGSTIASSAGNRYFQFRAIFTNTDKLVNSVLKSVTLDYTSNSIPSAPTFNAPGYVTSLVYGDDIKISDQTPTVYFSSIDDDNEDIVYEIEWDDDGSFGSSTTQDSTTHAGFVDEIDAGSSPFTSENTISYTWQSSLTNGTTYYYRVRAKDPAGSDTWSDWSETRAFTIDTSLPSSTANLWFQTETEQFNSNLSLNVDVDTASDQATIDSAANSAALYGSLITANAINSAADYWQTFSANHTLNNAVIKYQFNTLVGGVPTPIADSILPGNWEGFTTATVDLSGLDTTSYPNIIVKALMEETSASPVISDWQISLNALSATPTITTASFAYPSLNFEVSSTDSDNDYLRYKIEVCDDAAMTSNCDSFDQTVSQTGWSDQDSESNTAYASGSTATYSASNDYVYGSTHYYRVSVIDPAGTNHWVSTSVNSVTTNTPPSATNLTVNGSSNPIGLTDLVPNFSATFNDADAGATATKFQIQVTDNKKFTNFVWDSGEVTISGNLSNGNTLASIGEDPDYAGTPLSLNGQTYYWRLRFWDNTTEAGNWSTTAYFTMYHLGKPQTCLVNRDPSTNNLLIKWTDSNTNRTSITLEKSVNHGAFSTLEAALAPSTIEYLDSDTSVNNKYQYRLAVNYDGKTSDWCYTPFVDLSTGFFNFDGINLEGVNLF